MRKFIENFMGKVFKEFKNNISGKSFCALKEVRFDSRKCPDYNNELIQQYYLLRYFPAYLCEYKYLYSKIIRQNKIKDFSVMSVGCGVGADFYGLYLALNGAKTYLSYVGLDLINWKYKYDLGNVNYSFTQTNIANYEFEDESSINIFCFPKSLSEISDEDYKTFLDNVDKTTFSSNYIYVMSSIMDAGAVYDVKRCLDLVDVLKSKGYSCNKDIVVDSFPNKISLCRVDSEFCYPDEIKEYLIKLNTKCLTYINQGHNCNEDCEIQLSKHPVLKTTHMKNITCLLERY